MGEYHTNKKQYGIDNGIHIMNKNEAKKMRQIIAETGLTENEIRENEIYRKQLSEAQDIGEKSLTLKQKNEKKKNKIIKIITKELKLAKEHPSVIEAYKKYVKSGKRFGF